jgi:protein-S-isoprenylcysteine O-methyltransferase Ste14
VDGSHVTETSSAERGARVRVPPPLVFLGGILVGVACASLVAPAPVPVGRAVRFSAAFILVLVGLGFGASAHHLFQRTGQSPIPWKPSPSLLLTGPYRFTRNPMYVGMTLVHIGIGIAVNNLWIALFALPALVVVHFTAVLPEEKYLSEKFGEPYRTYLAEVRRYL